MAGGVISFVFASIFSLFFALPRPIIMLQKLVRTAGKHRVATTASYFSTESHPASSFLSGTNSIYVEEMYRLWSSDPTSVHSSWNVFFSTNTFQPNAAIQSNVGGADVLQSSENATGYHSNSDAVRAIHLIRAYQDRGHHQSDLDPLGLRREAIHLGVDAELNADTNPALYGFTAEDWDRPLELDGFTSDAQGGLLNNADLDGDGQTTFGELMTFLQQTYCGTVGYEFTHIRNKEQVNWCADQIEQVVQPCSNQDAKQVLERLDFATSFEATLAKRFNTEKRFGLEGLETLIPGLKSMIDVSSEHGAEDFVFGMAHRGRLNVLSNVIRKPMELIFKEFLGSPETEEVTTEESEDDWSSSGDVKYHLGTSSSRKYPDGRTVQLSLLANPSHLEAVNPLVMGKARAKMHYKGDVDGKTIVPVLLHGDAAFAGQGVVYESMQMTKLEGYSTGGTIHVVTNNQVGFTADPWQSRSTVYASDLGKTFDAPIFHVNADDVEACVRVFALAARYRQKFGNDVVVDLIGYRKNGHNEIDEPSFTQPLMYETIKKHPTSLSIYQQKLVASGVLSQAEVDETSTFVSGCFDDAFAGALDYVGEGMEDVDSPWKDMKNPNENSAIQTTGAEIDALRKVGSVLATVPEDFNIHRRLNNMVLKAKQKTLDSETDIDWGTAEALAFGTLLLEGTHVRVSGQDSQRGTFSHRHAVWRDQKRSGESYTPLNNISSDQAEFEITNSPLSEFGVMGFELGYSIEDPGALVIWEAQFGDFVNGAQIIIDQFITSGEAKWLQQSGITLLLPHQYQGQGPEHSSARVERFLQSCDEDPDEVPDLNESTTRQIQNHNWQIVNCTTPANYFHVLRRQQHRDFRKPLVVIAPKGLLRLSDCTSTFEDMAEGTFNLLGGDGVVVC